MSASAVDRLVAAGYELRATSTPSSELHSGLTGVRVLRLVVTRPGWDERNALTFDRHIVRISPTDALDDCAERALAWIVTHYDPEKMNP